MKLDRITRIPVFLAVYSSLFAVLAAGQQNPAQPQPAAAMQAVQTPRGFAAHSDQEQLEVTVCGDSVLHVTARPLDAAPAKEQQPWMLDPATTCPGAAFQFSESNGAATLTTAQLTLILAERNGNLNVKAPQGAPLLRERPNQARTYTPSEAKGLFHIEDRFTLDSTEALYGLGQHQSGMFNYRGSTVELGQNNTDIAIPLLVSSKGYAILWNTASFSYVDNRFPLELNLESMAAPQVDYYILYGPQLDTIIHQYRSLTGHAPLLPEWAYGFFQSKDRYKTQAEILSVANGYRSRHIPLDAIVQDWFWWKQGGEGDPVYNASYTDVPAELKTLHDEHIHAMISAWAMMDANSENFKLMSQKGFDVAGARVYDPTNPAGEDFYWNQFLGKLFADGWDAFWLDSSEPEEAWPHGGDAILRYKQLAIGSGLEYTNLFSMMHTSNVQAHWKAANPEKRVFLLTRSAFLGQQRNGATVWSGDVYSSWWALRRQVPAGLNFALSGYPYWTTDIGGYHPVNYAQTLPPGYQELYARWFEYGAFCPIFRTHGHRDANELWTYDKVYPALVAIDKLRYRLMPYIYSLAWKVTNEDSTIQRPLVMDFREDPATWEIGDQFLFGPAILVSPVLTEHATSRTVYLPAGAAWYDFWSGEKTQGGASITVEAPLDRIPLAVRAGSILPMGPEIEYARQAADPIELRIYPGADGNFTLYEDEGDSYRYEHGAHATISIRWNDAARTLTIGAREGSYTGMAPGHTFNVVVVSAGHGTGGDATAKPDKTVKYSGASVEVKF
ncbi:MAG: TIM-barrel domain-containing protein [Terracidiphilus sp.]|jgi:alpha-D-xyloside xylohydrolase